MSPLSHQLLGSDLEYTRGVPKAKMGMEGGWWDMRDLCETGSWSLSMSTLNSLH